MPRRRSTTPVCWITRHGDRHRTWRRSMTGVITSDRACGHRGVFRVVPCVVYLLCDLWLQLHWLVEWLSLHLLRDLVLHYLRVPTVASALVNEPFACAVMRIVNSMASLHFKFMLERENATRIVKSQWRQLSYFEKERSK